tara:strand:- start:2456 stop:2683 length:228 start_codon:yes stop_codon:yes gene_type:complete
MYRLGTWSRCVTETLKNQWRLIMTITIELKTIKNIAYDIIHDRRHDLDSSLDEVNAVESGLNILIKHLEEVYTNE